MLGRIKMTSIIYFDEGKFQKEWDEINKKAKKLGYDVIIVKELDDLFPYITHKTLIYTVPNSIKDWMNPREDEEEFEYIIVGPDTSGVLSNWLNKHKEKTMICKFRSEDTPNIKNAFKIMRIVLNGR